MTFDFVELLCNNKRVMNHQLSTISKTYPPWNWETHMAPETRPSQKVPTTISSRYNFSFNEDSFEYYWSIMLKIKAAVKVQGSYLFFFTLKVWFVFCKGISFHPCGTRPEETKNQASHVEKHTKHGRIAGQPIPPNSSIYLWNFRVFCLAGLQGKIMGFS